MEIRARDINRELLIRSQQRMQLLEGSIIVRNVPRQAKRVLDAAGIGRLISIQ